MTEALWHLQTLEERLDYLHHRLADRTTPGKKTYTRAEHAAIEWALKILKPLVESQRELAPGRQRSGRRAPPSHGPTGPAGPAGRAGPHTTRAMVG